MLITVGICTLFILMSLSIYSLRTELTKSREIAHSLKNKLHDMDVVLMGHTTESLN